MQKTARCILMNGYEALRRQIWGGGGNGGVAKVFAELLTQQNPKTVGVTLSLSFSF